MNKLRLLLLVGLISIQVMACNNSGNPVSKSSKIILVTGATGTQGGAVARELVKRGYSVQGLSRNPGSQRALKLTELGIRVIKGDFDDAASLDAAMQDVYGVFAVTNYWEHGFEREIAHGRQLIDAAERAGVRHFVFSSVAGADSDSDLPHFDSKAQIEAYLGNSAVEYTIVRPVEFLDNLRDLRPELMAGSFVDPRDSEKSHQWIAARDIGFFVGEAFDNPATWIGVTEEIAGVEMTLTEFTAAISTVLSVDVQHIQVSWEDYEVVAGTEITEMVRWFDEVGYAADIERLRDEHPDLLTVEDYLTGEGWNNR